MDESICRRSHPSIWWVGELPFPEAVRAAGVCWYGSTLALGAAACCHTVGWCDTHKGAAKRAQFSRMVTRGRTDEARSAQTDVKSVAAPETGTLRSPERVVARLLPRCLEQIVS